MTRSGSFASGRSRIGRPDVVLALLLAAAAAACEAPALGGRGEVIELDSDTVRLAPGVAVADVLLRAGARATVEPDTVRIRVGDVVRFTAADSRMHAIAFERTRIAPAGVAFLERTGQLRSPPLLTDGASWVVSFAGAPPGAYPFTDTSWGAPGAVLVAADARRN